MRLQRVLWLFPLVFLIHDGEEIATMPTWIEQNQAALAHVASLGTIGDQIVENLATTTTEVAAAVAFELLFILVATLLVVHHPRRRFGLYFYAALLGAFTFHVLTHVGQAVVFGGYIPGVVSAVLVIPPASYYLYRWLFAAKLLTWRSAVVSTVVGAIFLLPTLLLAHYVGRTLA
jgi:lipopolysaccharide export LptBFGC system permease protein LptF